MRDIAAVMITVDRSPDPSYLAETLENLKRSDLLTSERLVRFCLSDSGNPDWAVGIVAGLQIETARRPPFLIFGETGCASLNVAAALRTGAQTGTDWVLFLEDDIDVCGRFFDSVGTWLDDHARPDRHVYVFGANYGEVISAVRRKETSWDYPISRFYGTQAFAVKAEDALSLAEQLEADPYVYEADGTAYDLIMHGWARDRWPRVKHFLASAPSFVQHIGRTSVIRPRPKTHTFPSWPGREWSYCKADRQEAQA